MCFFFFLERYTTFKFEEFAIYYLNRAHENQLTHRKCYLAVKYENSFTVFSVALDELSKV